MIPGVFATRDRPEAWPDTASEGGRFAPLGAVSKPTNAGRRARGFAAATGRHPT